MNRKKPIKTEPLDGEREVFYDMVLHDGGVLRSLAHW